MRAGGPCEAGRPETGSLDARGPLSILADRARPLRVAIVGLGPKGLFALERLLDHAAALGPAALEVDVFEPHVTPGAGPIYDPAQPAYLRMNFAAEAVDMWWPGGTAVPPAQRCSFVTWREQAAHDSDRERYPARAEVGRYLVEGLAALLEHAPPGARVTVHRARVRALGARGRGWELTGTDTAESYDEVLVATGHERSWRGGLDRGWPHAAALVPSVFPVARWLCPERVAAGSTLAARGFALSFIDAALALTEGRGGGFEALAHPYRLRYSAGADDVGVLLPFTRTGRPMLAKPDPGLAQSVPALTEIAERARARIRGLADGCGVERDLVPILAATAHECLRAAGDSRSSGAPRSRRPANSGGLAASGDRPAAAHAGGAAIGVWLAAATAGVAAPAEHDPARELEHSLAVGAGLEPPDAQWALGHTWRAVYPAVVDRLSGDALDAREWPAFRRLGAALERIAFGPPPGQAAKLLALIEAGRVDLAYVCGGRLESADGHTRLCSARARREVDGVLDAVLPGPGALDAHSELLRALLADGHARVAAGRRGLDVSADGSCRGADGSTTPGLSAIGRASEDSVIGNDTLSRTLHPLADRWARRVVARCRERAPTGAT